MENPLHRHACEVAFGDTDASGWMHFPNIFRYVEAAEHEFLRMRGVLVFDRASGGWPRVKVACDFKRPLMCGDRIEVQLAILRLGASSITWSFEVLNAAGEIAAFGALTTVRVDHQGRPQLISDDERQKLESRL
jgi:YbgC/YbaW family acyl-CoA thioester hydrolase